MKLLFSLDHEIPDYVLGDQTRLVQILNNLVSNALKFTQDGSVEIRAMVESKQLESTTILFEVKDTGIGIPLEKKQRIFERFEQAENCTTRLYGGTGLGLNIVEKLVALYGSEVQLESEEGKGSLFSFKIEFKECTEYQPQRDLNEEEICANLFKDYKILLVEDNFHNQLLAKSYFKRWGAEIAIAENGEIALEALLKNDFDIILMDLQMPIMNGYITTNKIRTELKLDIPIIGCSANSKSSEQKKCIESGMNDYITKPYTEEDLIQTTSKYLNIKSVDLRGQYNQDIVFDDFTIIISDLRISLGDEVVCQAQEHFLIRTPLDIKEILSAVEIKDMVILGNKAHFIAGTLGVLKFNKGCELAKKLENAAKLGEISLSLILANRLIEHLNHAINCFKQTMVV